MERVLVCAAGGMVGRRIVELLRADGVPVRALVHRDGERADRLRALGAEVVVGDLTWPESVAEAIRQIRVLYFAMPVSPDHLLAAAVVASVAREREKLDALVGLSQMTVSQMTSTSTGESQQQRLHYLAERVFDWSGLPVVHIRPTAFLDNPLFTTLAAKSIRERSVLELPFGTGRTSPIAADDVARVVATVLKEPGPHVGKIYELTGPKTLDLAGLAEAYSRALGRKVTAHDVPLEEWHIEGLPPLVEQHVATMARLHRENRYDRASDDVERVTGQPARTVEEFVAARRAEFTAPSG
ncbi:NAD(P)H-binding protein [Dactylosporangium sp. CA-233914]|uniref:NAD(P)H-binding protein n=1 Tax=Dactylosporangium sp. CA-233914 TaxID=3239934 RepID=UPI003D89CFC9